MAALTLPETFVATSYDYVIAGGGTAGLTLATQLSEDPAVTVGVIEAGADQTENFQVLVPGLASSMLGNSSYDWIYQTTPQVNANGRVIAHPRGKQLGGSSAINFMFWTHASQLDIDDWGFLGNEGWSWKDLQQYFKKSETYVPPAPDAAVDLSTDFIDPAVHGDTGPLRNGFPRNYTNLQESWPQTYQTLGLAPNGDPRAGLALGGFSNPMVIDPVTVTRQYAANAYWKPNAARPNLKVLTGALVSNVVFAHESGPKGNLVATGVNFTVGANSYIVNATKEVVLSAGSFGSPQILELSGIGSAEILKQYGIPVRIDNPNVGENMQDHPLVPLGFNATQGQATFDGLIDPRNIAIALQEYQTTQTGLLASYVCSSALLSYEQCLVEGEKADGTAPLNQTAAIKGVDEPLLKPEEEKLRPGLKDQYKLTRDKLLNPLEAVAQEILSPAGVNFFGNASASMLTSYNAGNTGNFISFFGILTHPFSRGASHINSASHTAYPTIDPRYLSHPLDLEILSTIVLHLQKVAQTQPIASTLANNGTVYQPGYSEVTKDNVRDFIKNTVNSEYHPIGTCSMEPKNKGGVVDARLKVYGTANLRVVDASVFPLHVRGNPVSLVYAVAEKAADLIKADAKMDTMERPVDTMGRRVVRV
ncbi:MAG: hypothetical protein M1817_000709 [Caeruleum heppii]|nr:MAG: hypothetical protein M1817_000709 [Caeruleum heppii]